MKFVSPWWDADFADHGVHGGLAQKRTMQAATKLCRKRRRAVDVGAHIGLWTAFLASQFAAVEAFEPVLENFTCLCKNVDVENVLRRQVALGEHRGRASMERHGDNSGCWHVIEGRGVELLPLDHYVWTDVDLIKIDVEGLEGSVLRGARKTIAMSRPVVVIEYNGLGERLYGEDWVDPKAVLKEYGYQIQARLKKDEIWA